MTGNAEVTYMFLRGLPKSLLEDVLKAPQAVDYPATKEQAIQATRTQQLLQNILCQRSQNNPMGQTYKPPFVPRLGFRGGAFGNFQHFNNQQHGGFQPNYCPNNYIGNNNYQGNQNQINLGRGSNYNSTNAPRSMNNVLVLMDIDRTHFNRNRPPNQGYQNSGGRVANAGPNGQTHRVPNPSTNAPCFKCGAMDHWANKCPN